MRLDHLRIDGVRNLAPCTWQPQPGLNALVGPNGAGKTSVLEAVHLLGTGRSLRGAALDAVINYDAPALLVQGAVIGAASGSGDGPERRQQLGLRRERNGRLELRSDGETLPATSHLARLFPQQVVTPEAIALLSAGPGVRRRFIDWGVFHVEHGFMDEVRGYRRALSQRNAVLRQQGSDRALGPWEQELADRGMRIAASRARWLAGFVPVFREVLTALSGLDLQLTLHPGWDDSQGLDAVLAAGRDRDRRRGFTQQGPHRADLRVRVGSGTGSGRPAVEVLSRGQQKVAASALLAAQGRHLRQEDGRRCVVLVDDLAAELDEGHQDRLLGLLLAEHDQVLVTAVQETVVERVARHAPVTVFHVEHGGLRPADSGSARG